MARKKRKAQGLVEYALILVLVVVVVVVALRVFGTTTANTMTNIGVTMGNSI